MVNLRNYGVGTGYTSSGITGKKSVFSLGEDVFAAHVWQDLKGGEVFKIEFQRLEAGNYVTKNTQVWTNPAYSAAYQYAKFWDWPVGKYRCRFLLDNIFGGGQEFTITEEAPPTPPPVVKSDVNFITHPAGVPLYIDGVYKGKTNLVVKADAGSSHSYRIEIAGFKIISGTQIWPATGMITKTFSMEPIEVPPPVEETWWQKLIKIADWVIDFPKLIGLAPGAEALADLWKAIDEKTAWTNQIEDKEILLLEFPWWFAMPEGAMIAGLDDAGVIGARIPELVKLIKHQNWIKSVEWMKANPGLAVKNFPKLPALTKAQMLKTLRKDKLAVTLMKNLEKANYEYGVAQATPMWVKGVDIIKNPKALMYGTFGLLGAISAVYGYVFSVEWAAKEALVELRDFFEREEVINYKFNPSIELRDQILVNLDKLRINAELARTTIKGISWLWPWTEEMWDTYADDVVWKADEYVKAIMAVPIPAETGELTVTSNIDNSDVYIDGVKVGTTPYTKDLEARVYHVLVTKFGYTSQELDVDIIPGATPKFNAQISLLTPPPTGKGTLDISIEPTDAVLEVAGHPEINKMGAYEVDVGTYTIKASKENYYNKSVTAIAKEAEITNVSIVLSKKPEELPPELVKGTLTISVTPEDALIEVAGEEEITAPGTYELTPGSYAVRVSKEGFITDIKTAIVSEKKDTAISFILEAVEPVPPVIEKATITITSEPIDSDVYIDGVYKWTTTPYTILLDEGAYWIRVQKDKYYPVEIEVEVEAGEVVELPFVLEKIPDPEVPPYDYIPQTPYYPEYVPAEPYVPTYIPTSPAEIPPYNYSNLYPEVFDIPAPKPVSRPVEKELLINIETTDLKPWKGRIYSIALLDLSDPAAEILINVNDNEQLLIEEFLSIFNSIDPAKLVGFKLIFDYRYIFAKMMLYRMQNKRFADVGLRDVKQILDQVKEEFVYYPDKTGKLDDWGKALLGVGKYGSQELMLRKYISGDFDYVKEFQNRQIELTRDLYNLARFSMGKAFISSPSPVASPISTPEIPESTEIPVSTQQGQCPICFAFVDKTTGKCPICEPII